MQWYRVRFRDAGGDQREATFKSPNIVQLERTLAWLGFSAWMIIG